MTIIEEISRDHSLMNQIIQYVHSNKCIYQEIDEKSCYKWMNLNVSESYSIGAVLWQPGKVSFTQEKKDIISFDFSGCLMARIRFNSGRVVVAHVHTDENQENDTREYFATYLYANRSIIQNIQVFRPVCEIHDLISEDNTLPRKVCGVITSEAECYSIVLNYNTINMSSKRKLSDKSSDSVRYDVHKIYKHELAGFRLNDYKELLSFMDTEISFYERKSRLDTFWNIMKGKELYLSKTIKVLDKQSKYSVANEQHSCLII